MASTLPSEIVLLIYSHLHDAMGTTSARVISPTFRDAGLEHLTFKVSLTKHEPDLKILRDIADHPVVARTITTLICDDRSFLRLSYEPEEENAAYVVQELHRYGREQDPEKQAWYNRMCFRENRTRDGDHQVATLSSALPKLVNLKHIIVTDCFGEAQDGIGLKLGRSDTFQSMLRRQSPSNCGWFDAMTWDEVAFDTSDSWDAKQSRHHGFINLMRTLSICNRPIETLEVMGKLVGLSHLVFNVPPQDLQHVEDVFKSLRALKLTIDTDPMESSYAGPGDAPWINDTLHNVRMAQVLSSAQQLERLEISFMGIGHNAFYENEEVFFDVALGLGFRAWPCLRHFSLVACGLEDGRALANFFLRHRATLKSLHLALVHFESGFYSWGRVFHDMRQAGMRLDECELSIVSDPVNKLGCADMPEAGGNLVIQYLLDGKVNPAT